MKKLLIKLGLDDKDYKAVWKQLLKELEADRNKELKELELQSQKRQALLEQSAKELALSTNKLKVQKELALVEAKRADLIKRTLPLTTPSGTITKQPIDTVRTSSEKIIAAKPVVPPPAPAPPIESPKINLDAASEALKGVAEDIDKLTDSLKKSGDTIGDSAEGLESVSSGLQENIDKIKEALKLGDVSKIPSGGLLSLDASKIAQSQREKLLLSSLNKYSPVTYDVGEGFTKARPIVNPYTHLPIVQNIGEYGKPLSFIQNLSGAELANDAFLRQNIGKYSPISYKESFFGRLAGNKRFKTEHDAEGGLENATGYKGGLEEFKGGLEGIGRSAGKGKEGIRGMIYEVRGFLNLLGLHANYPVTRFLAGMEAVQRVMSVTFLGVGVIMLTELLEQFIEKVSETSDALLGWDRTAKKLRDDMSAFNLERKNLAEEQKVRIEGISKIGIEGPLAQARKDLELIKKEQKDLAKLQDESIQGVGGGKGGLNQLIAERDLRRKQQEINRFLPYGEAATRTISSGAGPYNIYRKLATKKIQETMQHPDMPFEEFEKLVDQQQRDVDERGKKLQLDIPARIKEAEARIASELQTVERQKAKALQDRVIGIEKARADLILANAEDIENKKYQLERQGLDNRMAQTLREGRETQKDVEAEIITINGEIEEAEVKHQAVLYNIRVKGAEAVIDAESAARKQREEASRNDLSLEEWLVKQSYDTRLITFDEYLQKKEDAAAKRARFEVEAAEKERIDAIAKLALRAKGMGGEQYQAEFAQIQTRRDEAVERAQQEHRVTTQENAEQFAADELRAKETAIQQSYDITKAGLERELALYEHYNELKAYTYEESFNKRKQQLYDELAAEITFAQKKFLESEDQGPAAKAARDKEIMDAAIRARAGVQALGFQTERQAREEAPSMTPPAGTMKSLENVGAIQRMTNALDNMSQSQQLINAAIPKISPIKILPPLEGFIGPRIDQTKKAEKALGSDLVDAVNKSIKSFEDFTSNLSQGVQEIASVFASFGGGPKAAGFFQSFNKGVTGGGAGIGIVQGVLGVVAPGMSASLSKFVGKFGGLLDIGLGVLSVVMDHFKEQARRLAHQITSDVLVIQRAFQSQSIGAGTALSEIEAQKTKAVTELPKHKGGREQLSKILPQLDDQIFQLQNSIKQTTREMELQITVLRGPMGYQDQISSLQQIVEQYRTYTLSVEDQAAAYEYLQLALAKYIHTQEQDLANANETAIQDGLKLNDLEYDRMKLIRDSAMQEWNVLTEGVLIRRQTAAQNKLYQLDIMKQERDRQLQTLDQEIKVTQYKVDQEKLVFDIASNRIDLENQLTAAQIKVINFDMERIIALKETLSEIKDLSKTLNTAPALSYDMVASLFNWYYQNFGQKGYPGFYGETS